MNRKLASIQIVSHIEPIPGADAIELARIQGWQCVVKKNTFVPGDLGVFFEIDSQPPDTPDFSFLWTPRGAESAPVRPENFRLRTMRLRGCLSQGLLLPLTAFPQLCGAEREPGCDVTARLGVTKWEPPLPVNGDVSGPFLTGVPKTDEMRVQSVPDVLTELHGLPWVATLKCDGMSVSYGVERTTGEFTVCGRNWALCRGTGGAWAMAGRYDLEALLRTFPHLVIQAELVGPGIQGNRLGLSAVDLRVYNVYDQQAARYFDHEEAATFLYANGIPMVPVVDRGEAFAHQMDSLLALAEGLYPDTRNEREGIVVRPSTERVSGVLGGRLSFKAISNRFLLKGGD